MAAGLRALHSAAAASCCSEASCFLGLTRRWQGLLVKWLMCPCCMVILPAFWPQKKRSLDKLRATFTWGSRHSVDDHFSFKNVESNKAHSQDWFFELTVLPPDAFSRRNCTRHYGRRTSLTFVRGWWMNNHKSQLLPLFSQIWHFRQFTTWDYSLVQDTRIQPCYSDESLVD